MQKELTKKSMEGFLALFGTASQARGFILLDVRQRFEEDVALDNACGGVVYLGVIAGHCASRIAHSAPHALLRVAPRAAHIPARCAPRASLLAALHTRYCALPRAQRASLHAARRARHSAPRAACSACRALLRAERAGCTPLTVGVGNFIVASMIGFSGGTIGPQE